VLFVLRELDSHFSSTALEVLECSFYTFCVYIQSVLTILMDSTNYQCCVLSWTNFLFFTFIIS